jgi:hypothetical protein
MTRRYIDRVARSLKHAYRREVAAHRLRQIEAWRRAEQEEEDIGYIHLDNAARFGRMADRAERVYHAGLSGGFEVEAVRQLRMVGR